MEMAIHLDEDDAGSQAEMGSRLAKGRDRQGRYKSALTQNGSIAQVSAESWQAFAEVVTLCFLEAWGRDPVYTLLLEDDTAAPDFTLGGLSYSLAVAAPKQNALCVSLSRHRQNAPDVYLPCGWQVIPGEKHPLRRLTLYNPIPAWSLARQGERFPGYAEPVIFLSQRVEAPMTTLADLTPYRNEGDGINLAALQPLLPKVTAEVARVSEKAGHLLAGMKAKALYPDGRCCLEVATPEAATRLQAKAQALVAKALHAVCGVELRPCFSCGELSEFESDSRLLAAVYTACGFVRETDVSRPPPKEAAAGKKAGVTPARKERVA